MLDQREIGYATLKAMASELGRPLDDNDPYIADRPGRRRDGAEWFAALWHKLKIPDGVHLRRLHYLLMSSTGITIPNGERYLNTHRCWKLLGACSADARFLDLVPAEAFVDRRAPEPTIYVPDDEAVDESVGIYNDEPSFPDGSDVPLLHYVPQAYPFPALSFIPPKLVEPAIELWVEKSTADDILDPLARRLGVSLVTGLGKLSITACLAVVRRVTCEQGLDALLAHLVADTFAATCAAGQRDYLDRCDLEAICDAARGFLRARSIRATALAERAVAS